MKKPHEEPGATAPTDGCANDQDSTSVLSLLAAERIRAAYHLCHAPADDLKGTDVEFQRGSLVELYEITKTLIGD